ncbi:MAG TPA: SRPBCC domain-containing protein, partial [Methylomirabilota bacterium]|nr:SRPBCC domain-containing protein [Methylomirabilota bacterium]
PFIRSIDGAPEKGASRLLIPGIFDGEHRFVIEPLPNGQVRVQQSERCRGVLVPLFRGSLDRDTKRGFQEMNVALKRQAEWCRT